MSLSPVMFADYFRALWGKDRDPYPWQQRLVDEVYESGRWPAQLDLPTGAGKTSALDIALFLLAIDADKPAAKQCFPRRTFLVVDRRTIVDQGFERAKKICEALARARDGVLGEVAQRLRSLFGGKDTDPPVAATILRGAMVRDDAWARRPDQPLLALSTVDQVGSRLLFRGYGVSDGMKPVHAGLLGRDCLYLLDEVHLSQPFEETLSALFDKDHLAVRGRYLDERARVQVSRLSATPRGDRAFPFQLSDEDRRHPRLKLRLEARKPATLQLVDAKGEEPEKVALFAEEIAKLARGLAKPGKTVGVIVNRVETARQVARALADQGEQAGWIKLITGRMRPLDRQRVEDEIQPWIDPDRANTTEGPTRYVVATQCLEAGADYDFNALVTECAPLDALRQRVGRLNRSGTRDGARAVVVMRKDLLKSDDPVYGSAMASTWTWLQAQGELGFGISAFSAPEGDDLKPLLVETEPAPLLLPSYLDALAQTSPVPNPDPDIALFLHGPHREQREVSVIWRADLSPELFTKDGLPALLNRLEAAPPGSLEALPLPIGALRRWLDPRDRRPISLSDGGPPLETEENNERRRDRGEEPLVLCWRGEKSDIVRVSELKPGDTIVLPSSRGGLSMHNFDPTSREHVPDLGDEVQLKLRGRPTLRLYPAMLQRYDEWGAEGTDLLRSGDEDGELQARLDEWLAQAPAEARAQLGLDALARSKPRLIVHEDPSGTTLTFVGRKARAGQDASTEADTSSHTGAKVSLSGHLLRVGSWARIFAERVGLQPKLVDALEAAGQWHDLGKRDPRFQLWLHNGNPVAAALASEPLAKSATPAQDRAAREKALEKSRYPKGARHEMMSLALLERATTRREALKERGVDWDLVCYLVASHHGFGRPFVPFTADTEPVDVAWEGVTASSAHGLERLDSGVADRFWRLVRRYTPHGLAHLEALLRLADHHVSALEQQPELV